MRYSVLPLLLLSMPLLTMSCSGSSEDKWTAQRPDTFPAAGIVTFDGKPLPEATVVFQSTGGEPQAAVGRTDENGEFQLRTFTDGDGAIAGEHKVTVVCSRTEGPPDGANLDEANVVIQEVSLIPERYADPAKSGLTASVTPGQENKFTFHLDKE